jgi:hypothetical protein
MAGSGTTFTLIDWVITDAPSCARRVKVYVPSALGSKGGTNHGAKTGFCESWM